MIYRGIDISGWQKSIDWERVITPENKIDFAIIKIGENGAKSAYFDKFYNACRDYDVKIGCYYYLNRAERGDDIGPNIIRWLDGRKLEYPVYLDVEETGTDKNRNTVIAVETGEYLEQRGYYYGIYCSTYWMDKLMDIEAIKRFDKWWAGWVSNNAQNNWPTVRYDKRHADKNMWQFGTIKLGGYSLDGNLCRINYPEIMKQHHRNGY